MSAVTVKSHGRIRFAITDAWHELNCFVQAAVSPQPKYVEALKQRLRYRLAQCESHSLAVADAQIELALELRSAGTVVDWMHAEALLNDAQFTLVTLFGPYSRRVSRVMHVRGILQTNMGNFERALTFHQAAETVYRQISPLSYDRAANLSRLADAQDSVGLRSESTKTRHNSESLSQSLLLRSPKMTW